MKEIIGIAGEKHAGKDTASAIFVNNYGFKSLSFATLLKDMITECTGLNNKYFFDPEVKDGPFPEKFALEPIHVDGFIDFLSDYRSFSFNDMLALHNIGNHTKFDSPRKLIQFVGTDMFRSLDSNFWVDAFEKEMQKYEKVIVPDVRFFNERLCVWKHQGLLILVQREGSKTSDGHSSENSLGKRQQYDFVVNNNASISDLHFAVECCYKMNTAIRKGLIG